MSDQWTWPQTSAPPQSGGSQPVQFYNPSSYQSQSAFNPSQGTNNPDANQPQWNSLGQPGYEQPQTSTTEYYGHQSSNGPAMSFPEQNDQYPGYNPYQAPHSQAQSMPYNTGYNPHEQQYYQDQNYGGIFQTESATVDPTQHPYGAEPPSIPSNEGGNLYNPHNAGANEMGEQGDWNELELEDIGNLEETGEVNSSDDKMVEISRSALPGDYESDQLNESSESATLGDPVQAHWYGTGHGSSEEQHYPSVSSSLQPNVPYSESNVTPQFSEHPHSDAASAHGSSVHGDHMATAHSQLTPQETGPDIPKEIKSDVLNDYYPKPSHDYGYSGSSGSIHEPTDLNTKSGAFTQAHKSEFDDNFPADLARGLDYGQSQASFVENKHDNFNDFSPRMSQDPTCSTSQGSENYPNRQNITSKPSPLPFSHPPVTSSNQSVEKKPLQNLKRETIESTKDDLVFELKGLSITDNSKIGSQESVTREDAEVQFKKEKGDIPPPNFNQPAERHPHATKSEDYSDMAHEYGHFSQDEDTRPERFPVSRQPQQPSSRNEFGYPHDSDRKPQGQQMSGRGNQVSNLPPERHQLAPKREHYSDHPGMSQEYDQLIHGERNRPEQVAISSHPFQQQPSSRNQFGYSHDGDRKTQGNQMHPPERHPPSEKREQYSDHPSMSREYGHLASHSEETRPERLPMSSQPSSRNEFGYPHDGDRKPQGNQMHPPERHPPFQKREQYLDHPSMSQEHDHFSRTEDTRREQPFHQQPSPRNDYGYPHDNDRRFPGKQTAGRGDPKYVSNQPPERHPHSQKREHYTDHPSMSQEYDHFSRGEDTRRDQSFQQQPSPRNDYGYTHGDDRKFPGKHTPGRGDQSAIYKQPLPAHQQPQPHQQRTNGRTGRMEEPAQLSLPRYPEEHQQRQPMHQHPTQQQPRPGRPGPVQHQARTRDDVRQPGGSRGMSNQPFAPPMQNLGGVPSKPSSITSDRQGYTSMASSFDQSAYNQISHSAMPGWPTMDPFSHPGMLYRPDSYGRSGSDVGGPVNRPSSRNSISSDVGAADDRQKMEELYKQQCQAYMEMMHNYFGQYQNQGAEADYTSDPYYQYYQYYQYYYGSSATDQQAEQVPSGRYTPKLFSYPHRKASIAAPGIMVQVEPTRPDEKEPAFVELLTMPGSSEERNEHALFPGPLSWETTVKMEALAFLKDKLEDVQDRMPTDWESATLLINYLKCLVWNNGNVPPTDLSSMLLDGHEPNTADLRSRGLPMRMGSVDHLASLPPSEPPSGRTSPQHGRPSSVASSGAVAALYRAQQVLEIEKDDRFMDRYRNLLMCGRKLQALEYACAHSLWDYALALSHQISPEVHAKVHIRFLNGALKVNDPLHTLHQMLAGEMPDSVTAPLRTNAGFGSDRGVDWGDWRPHLAMILSNQRENPQLAQDAMIRMGDTLAGKQLVYASQLCYLLSGVAFQSSGSKGGTDGKVLLLGASHWAPRGQKVDLFQIATNEAIQLTEIYEYAMSLADRNFFLPHLQPYKYLYATRLLDAGFVEQSYGYCREVAGIVNRNPDLFGNSLIRGLTTLAERLQYHPHCRDRGSLLDSFDWIGQLRANCQTRQENIYPAFTLATSTEVKSEPSFQYDQPDASFTTNQTVQNYAHGMSDNPLIAAYGRDSPIVDLGYRQHQSVTQQQPTMTQQQPTMTQQQPTMTQQQPTMTQQQPTMMQQQPTMTQQQPTMTQQQPTMTQQQPTMTQQQPTMMQQQPPIPGFYDPNAATFHTPNQQAAQTQQPTDSKPPYFHPVQPAQQQSPFHQAPGYVAPGQVFHPQPHMPSPGEGGSQPGSPRRPSMEDGAPAPYDYFNNVTPQWQSRRNRTQSGSSTGSGGQAGNEAYSGNRSRAASGASTGGPAHPRSRQSSISKGPPTIPEQPSRQEGRAQEYNAGPGDGKQGGGLLSYFWPTKKTGPKKAHLPDDSNKTIVYDKAKDRWVDTSAPEEVDEAPPPPPIIPTSRPVAPATGQRSRYANAAIGSTKPLAAPITMPMPMFPQQSGQQPAMFMPNQGH